MSQQTLKLGGWKPQAPPPEDGDVKFHRQLLVEIIYGLFYKKKKFLEGMSMPPQPISLEEIWEEFCSRRTMMQSIKDVEHGGTMWKWVWHSKRWVDRRVNETATPQFYPNGVPKVVATSAGLYQPNQVLFKETEREKT